MQNMKDNALNKVHYTPLLYYFTNIQGSIEVEDERRHIGYIRSGL